MLTISLNNNAYSFAESWDELTPSQFTYLVGLLNDYHHGSISKEVVQTLFFIYLAGLKPRRIRSSEKKQLLSENIFRIARNLNFMFRIEYQNQKAFSSFTPEIRQLLTRWMPEDIDGDLTEVRAAVKMKKEVVVDCVISANLIPEIRLRRKVLSGYQFTLAGQVLKSNLKAGAFMDACTLHDQYLKFGDQAHLDALVAELYSVPDDLLGKIPPETKVAILFNFQGVLHFLSERTHYSILWNSGEEKKASKISLGFADSLYSLAKAGYGSTMQLKDLSVIEFLDLILKELIDACKTLKDAGKKLPEIAEATKLTMAQVQMLI